ncbi:BA14K family protein [Stappia sp.]|uniref:BA14K family protein n=1 Tax=Stappia sp. TaxID=1870903 RepID=UPI003D14ED98
MRFKQTCAAVGFAIAAIIGFGSATPANAATAATAAAALAPLVAVPSELRSDGTVTKAWHRGRPHRYRPRRRWRPRTYRPRYYAPRPRVRGLGRAHYNWCSRRYRSYRPGDNSFQPYNGPRRACISPYIR